MKISDFRTHPRFWDGTAIMVGIIIGSILFNFFTGFYPISIVTGSKYVDQTIVNVESSDGISVPPILIVPRGVTPLNSTYNTSVNGQFTVYMWVIQFANNTIHPNTIKEPTYIYWQGVPCPDQNLLCFSLYAVYVRFHFFSRLIYGGWTLNGTRLFVSYSPTFYIPTVKGGILSNLLKPGNATVIFNYPTILDPNIPYSNITQSNPTYTPDPWVVLGSPETIQTGLIFGSIGGSITGLISYGLILGTVHPITKKHRYRVKKYLAEELFE